MTTPSLEHLDDFLTALRGARSGPDLARLSDFLHQRARRAIPPHDVALRRRFDSLDLQQDALMHLAEALPLFRGTTWREFLAFAGRVLEQRLARAIRRERSQARDWHRERGWEHLDATSGEEGTPSRLLMAGEDEERLHAAIASLAEEDRKLIELRLQGLDHPEIAARLCISPAAARKRFSRALRRLEDRFEAG